MRKKTAPSVRLLILAVSLTFVPAHRAGAQTKLVPPATSVPLKYFGLHIHRASDRDWPTIRFGTWRLWDAHVTWIDLEPRKGQWDFRELDNDVQLAEQHGVELILTLGMTPTWASANPEKGPTDRRGSTAGPKDMKDWDDYVRTIGNRYRGKVGIYEIWNEPNGPGFYTGSFQEMVLLARDAYNILHGIDSSITVISPSPSGSGLPFLETYLRDGGGQYADVIGFHFYVSPKPPETMLDLIAKVKDVMANHGQAEKPLWDTEVGYYVQSQAMHVEAPAYMGIVLSPEQAMAYVARAYILNWAADVRRLCWYDWDSNVEGLGDFAGTLPKPAAGAYGRVEQWLVGATMTSCASDSSGVWVCDLSRPRQYGGHIVWNPQRQSTFNIPRAWNVRWLVSLSGNNRLVANQKSVQIGPSPILLENYLP